MNESDPVGGQAVIEGVMMRTPRTYTIAVRAPSGEITVKKQKYTSLTKRYKILGWPFLRGFIVLIETLYIGISALSFSGEIALREEPDQKEKSDSTANKTGKTGFKEKLSLSAAILLAFAFAIILFTLIPYALSELLQGSFQITKDSISFNVIAGLIRILIFITYLWLITMMKDIQRVFEYHGAEHKSIFAFESQKPLDVDHARHFSTRHPRCGTSFLLIVLLAAICIYIGFDTLITLILGTRPTLLFRILSHIAILPLIAGTAYELIRWSGKHHAHHSWIKAIASPGLWLQKITTREPSNDQLEVALTALREALLMEREEFAQDLTPSPTSD